MAFLLGNGGGNIAVGTSASPGLETSVMTTVPVVGVNYPGGAGAMVWGSFNFTPGTGATGVDLRVRRGAGKSGSVLGPVHHFTGLTAGDDYEFPFSYWDDAQGTGYLGINGQPAFTMQYSITLLQTGSPTATGLVNYMTMAAYPTVNPTGTLIWTP